MRRVLLPKGISGSGKDYPYLARLIPRFSDYSTIIMLITKEKQTVLLGRYTGPYHSQSDLFTPGNTLPHDNKVPEVYLIPLNKGRL